MFLPFRAGMFCSPCLLCWASKEDNTKMRWVWPSTARVDDDWDKEEYYSSTGDARPDFLCVGSQKGGTSWLYGQLACHPDFWMPPVKELHYFDLLARTRADPPRPPGRTRRLFSGTGEEAQWPILHRLGQLCAVVRA